MAYKRFAALIVFLFLIAVGISKAQVTLTPNLSLQLPFYQQVNWQVPIDYDFNVLDEILGGVGNLPTGPTPTISYLSNWLTTNTASTSITNFVGGFPGQMLRIICGTGDTFTSIVPSSTISLVASWSCSSSSTITLVLVNGVWTELSRAYVVGAGTGTVTNALGTPNEIVIVSNPTTTPLIAIANPFIFPGKATGAASTTLAATSNFPSGVAPASPINGDFWNQSGVLQFYDGTYTNQLTTIRGSVTIGDCPKFASTAGLLADNGACPTSSPVGNVGDLQDKATSSTFGASHINDNGTNLLASEPFYFAAASTRTFTTPAFGFFSTSSPYYFVDNTPYSTSIYAAGVASIAPYLSCNLIVEGSGTPSCGYFSMVGASATAYQEVIGTSFMASISGTTMTVSTISTGVIYIGMPFTGTGVTSGTVVVALGSGSGATGTYSVNHSQTVASTTMTATSGFSPLVSILPTCTMALGDRHGGCWGENVLTAVVGAYTISSISRSGGTVTATLAASSGPPNGPIDPPALYAGDTIYVQGVSDSSYNSPTNGFGIENVSGHTLQWAQSGPNSTSSGGTVTLDAELFGNEVNIFNDIGDTGGIPLAGRQKAAFAATSSGGYPIPTAFLCDSSTYSNQFHVCGLFQNWTDIGLAVTSTTTTGTGIGITIGGNNDFGYTTPKLQYGLYFSEQGTATSSINYPSNSIAFVTETWNGTEPSQNFTTIQDVPQTGTGSGHNLEITENGNVIAAFGTGAQFQTGLAGTGSVTTAQLQFSPLTNDPVSPSNGWMWYNSTLGQFRCEVGGIATNCDNGTSAGAITMVSGVGSHTFTTAFGGGAPICIAKDVTTAANSVGVTSTTTAVSVTGTGSDVVNWMCSPANN